ncbi:MAG: hypothetical protein ACOCRO_01625 [Halanaerobiales bacterium]
MRAWWILFKKELSNNLFVILVIALLTIAWQVFLYYKAVSWPYGLSFGLSFLPFSFYPLVLLYMGYNAYRQEWKDDTSYFLLSLPRYGWQISLAKLASSMTFYILITALTIGLIYIFQHTFIRRAILDLPGNINYMELIFNIAGRMLLAYIMMGLGIYVLSQFSQLISLFYDRFRGLITVIVFILSNYLVYRAASFLAPLLGWLPDIPITNLNILAGEVNTSRIYIGSGPFAGVFIVLLALFLLASWLLETQLEV